MSQPRILIACIGNIFLGDDAFGVEVARRLERRNLPDGVQVKDFGIRSFDLAMALLAGHDGVILVDAAPRGEPPGTLYVMELASPLSGEGTAGGAARPVAVETHGMGPEKVLALAAAMGGPLPRMLLVGCEPTPLDTDSDMMAGLSPPVLAAIDEAIVLIESCVRRFSETADAMPITASAAAATSTIIDQSTIAVR